MTDLQRRCLLSTAARLSLVLFSGTRASPALALIEDGTEPAPDATGTDQDPPGAGPELRPANRLLGAAPPPGIQVARNTVFYDVVGGTVAALEAQLTRLGPRDGFGGWAAATQWGLRWSYPYQVDAGLYNTGPIRVDVTVAVTLPRWNPPSGAPRGLIERWNRYLAAVSLHESGHDRIAVQAGYELQAALLAMPAFASCQELDQTARAVGQGLVNRFTQQQIDYDRETLHGATQGAVFP